MAALLERWDTCGDRRGLFLHSWAKTTDMLMRGARNERFCDSLWVLRLLDQLSDYYYITVEPDGDDRARVTPGAWKAAHAAAESFDTPPLTAIMLGYNAHLSNDLAQAVADLLIAEWPLGNVRLERRYQDFRLACDMIVASAPASRSAVMAWLDDVWGEAVSLVTAVSEGWRDAIRDSIEHTALRRAHLLACDIDGGSQLLMLTAERLDRCFPPRHEPAACRLQSVLLPAWGTPARAAS